MRVGRLAGDVGGQRATPFGHDAQAAEYEDFRLARHRAAHLRDFSNAQDARENHALDAEGLHVKRDRIAIGRRGLHRQMPAQIWMALGGIGEKPDVGENDRVDGQSGGVVDGPAPWAGVARARERVDGDQDLGAVVVCERDGLAQLVAGEIQSGEIARVGLVAKAAIDGVGPGLNGCPQRGRSAGGADKL